MLAMLENLGFGFAITDSVGQHHMVEVAHTVTELPQEPGAVKRGGVAEQEQGAIAPQLTQPGIHRRVDLENIGKSLVKLLV